MKRTLDINEISDGTLYKSYSLVKIGCSECKGCSECCKDVGNTITLDPYDIFSLSKGLGCLAEEMINKGFIELSVIDYIILPNLKTPCSFLNNEGRCSIHAFRPGLCRLYPLGRVYNEDGFDYFIQKDECPFPDKTKVKVEKWLEIPELNKYENYIKKWHFFLKNATALINKNNNDEYTKNLNMKILNTFFLSPYNTDCDFYEQFMKRLSALSVQDPEI